ncbi:MAG TPA: nucleotide exchange factor GrpE [Candidatus Paceibacterota bacterium]|nr:nucleotide exchange factor GrpE [Candidatus Paceibacterota bacterium]
MNDATHWKIPKWPFLLGDALLLAIAYFFILHSPHPVGRWEIAAVSACAALGAVLGCVPFILDYRVMIKAVDAAALGGIAEKIQSLEKLAAQISGATNEWTNAQALAEKTSAGAKDISGKMAEEVRQFTAFMQKMNDSEKSALRLEVDKLRRGEAEWLQVLVRILDHVFLLHAAAARSRQPKVAAQISQFQDACRDAVRRIGLTVFVTAPDEPFNAERHQTVDESKPPADAVVAETVGTGYTFQGKLLRPALVRLKEKPPEKIEAVEAPPEAPATE